MVKKMSETARKYRLKSGQINFESIENSGAYECVVIKNGRFHNLTDQLRAQLIEALSGPEQPGPETEELTIDDML